MPIYNTTDGPRVYWSPTLVSGTPDDAWGSWAEIVSSTSSEIYVVGFSVRTTANVSYVRTQLGRGAVGSEVTLNQVVTMVGGSSPLGQFVTFPVPLKISSGTRVVVRAASVPGNLVVSFFLHFIEYAKLENPVLNEVISPDGAVVADAGNNASTFKTNLTETATDFWKGCFLKFKTGSLTNQVRRVISYNGSTKFITCDTFTGAPSAGDTFDLINR